MNMIIFDDGCDTLPLLTDLRPVFEVRTGILTTRERINRTRLEKLSGLFVPQPLADLTAELVGDELSINNLTNRGNDFILINGRWLNVDRDLTPDLGCAIMSDEDTADVIIARLTAADASDFLTTNLLPDTVKCETHSNAHVLRNVWDVIRHRDAMFDADVPLLNLIDTQVPSPDIQTSGKHPLEIHESARVYPNAFFDLEHGPIIVDERAVIRPGAILAGPCYVGCQSVVVDRAHIKAGTVIGPVCKVGGEVGGTIFQGFSNKSHEGHLGDSWVGEWVNFGAGTTNSNLLNTYGQVMMKPTNSLPRSKTDLTFLGAIIGDHVKFAIETRLMTGTAVGTGAMIATTASRPMTVDAFAWLTDAGHRRYRLDKFLDVAKTVMGRRNIAMSPAYEARLTELHNSVR